MVASTREASTAAKAKAVREVVGRGRSVARLARQWEGSAPCSRGEANPEADHLGGKYPGGELERYQYALELRSRKHVATGESGRRPGWPPPGTQASRHDMNSGWTCRAEAFGPGSRRAPLRCWSTVGSRAATRDSIRDACSRLTTCLPSSPCSSTSFRTGTSSLFGSRSWALPSWTTTPKRPR